jgi:DNA-directed RNA polymerase subunit H
MAKKTKEPLMEIMKHDLVPEHIILSEKEKHDVLKQYNTELNLLPKILIDDPVALSIGAQPGQIIKIIRKSATAKQANAYRLVVEDSK